MYLPFIGKLCESTRAPMHIDSSQTHRSHPRAEALYRKYGAVIFSRCRKLLRDAALAEDATQEVFTRVMKHIETAPDDQMALAWIYRISTNYCLNVLRDRERQAQSVAVLPEVAGHHPEAELIERSLALQLLARAPEKVRIPAKLYYVDGFEQEQIARALGVSRRTVVNHLNRFLSRAKEFVSRDLQAA